MTEIEFCNITLHILGNIIRLFFDYFWPSLFKFPGGMIAGVDVWAKSSAVIFLDQLFAWVSFINMLTSDRKE